MDYSFENVLILGFGKSGISAQKYINKHNGKSLYFDDSVSGGLDFNDAATMIREKKFSLCVISPGVSIDSNIATLAKENQIPIISEFDLGLCNYKGKIIAITGTNGKTTTATLLAKILQEGGIDCNLAGNIGVPTTSLEDMEKVGVFEVSSFMLEGNVNFKPDISVILNVLPDHISRHGSFEKYLLAKKNVYKNADKHNYLVLNYEDENLKKIDDFKGKTYWFSKTKKVNGAYFENSNLLFGKGTYITGLYSLKGMGVHNLENVLACITVAKIFGISDIAIERAIKKFKGISHRIEFVKEVDGVNYYDDSKGTNVASTLFACNAMTGNTVLILGGVDKGCEFDELFCKLPSQVKAIVVVGEAKNKIYSCAKKYGFNNVVVAGTFKEAVLHARLMAKRGWSVLLSPACASFDMFKNYEERGGVYGNIVKGF